MTPQSGVHLALWIVPLVREAKDGTPRAITVSALEARMRENPGVSMGGNPFTDSARYRKMAVEELRKLGVPAIVKAWIYGIAINLASPAVTMAPTVVKLPRTGFYDTAGRTFVDKVTNILFRSENALYAWFHVIGIVGTVASRLAQAAGAFVMVHGEGALWPLLIMIAWALFILMINGPIASPKYRLPIEAVLAVMTGARVRLTLVSALDAKHRMQIRPTRPSSVLGLRASRGCLCQFAAPLRSPGIVERVWLNARFDTIQLVVILTHLEVFGQEPYRR